MTALSTRPTMVAGALSRVRSTLARVLSLRWDTFTHSSPELYAFRLKRVMAPFHRLVELTPVGRFDPQYLPFRTRAYQAYLSGRSVLDVGCGPGLHCERFRSQLGVTTTVGLDYSQGMVAAAAGRGMGAHFVVGDARRLPFPDGAFDSVHSSMLLHHLPERDRQLAVAEMVRVARETVLIEELTGIPNPFLRPLHQAFCAVTDGSYRRFTPREWSRFLEGWPVREQIVAEGSIRARLALFVIEKQGMPLRGLMPNSA